MTVTERHLVVPVEDGSMETMICDPGRPAPVVIIFMDGPGLRGDLEEIAHRLAGGGYFVALPDLYYRYGPRPQVDIAKVIARDEIEFDRITAMIIGLDDEQVLAETETVVRLLEEEPNANTEQLACLGFCMGARFVLRAMARLSPSVVAGAVLHPSFVVEPGDGSPHLDARRLHGALYVSHGGVDTITPVETLEPLWRELDQADADVTIEIQPGADHGFAFPDMPAYDAGAAERSWKGVFALLHGAFGAPAEGGDQQTGEETAK